MVTLDAAAQCLDRHQRTVPDAPTTGLGRMCMTDTLLRHTLGGYREYAPPALFAVFCESIWTYRTPPSLPDAMHCVLPDPSVNIGYAYLRDASGRPCDIQLIVIGPKTRPTPSGTKRLRRPRWVSNPRLSASVSSGL